MRAIFAIVLVVTTAAASPARSQEAPSPEQQYLATYLKINEAEQAERKGDINGARNDFAACYRQLLAIHKADPDWELALMLHRLADCKAKIIELSGRVNPPVPVLPGMFELVAKSSHNLYPWKENITVDQFWIGKDGAKGSAWSPDWVRDNGGADTPYDSNGYATGGHASRVNPFYVALPFNDLAHPDLAQKWLPKGWLRAARNGKPISSCKDRWVELKNARGDVCYAQWEDVGPDGTDQAAYVFGNQAPGKPGVDLSPAVYEYLGLGPGGQGQTVSWRFVDEADVRPGAWLKLGEQAVIYLALHQEQ
jgi:hypothetical protein